MDAYNASLAQLDETQPQDVADVCWAVGRLFELQVGKVTNACVEGGTLSRRVLKRPREGGWKA